MSKRTPFYDFHVSSGAKMVDFAGWEMPILYRSIADEHTQTRTGGSFFDVSHMGRVKFSGSDAQKFLDRVVTRKIDDQIFGQSRYTLVCNEAGGVLDDIIISRDAKHWLMVCNASNRDKLMAHFVDVRRKEDLDFDMADETGSTAMVALQGPAVIDKLEQKLKLDIRGIKRYHFKTETIFAIVKLTIFRSGYTGEDGVELILPAKMTSMAMKFLGGQLEKADATLKPAGLGARDTLRLEAGMPLYGHELSEAVDPISAGLAWAVDLKKNFIGVESLRAIAEKGPARKLVGLELEGKRIARQASPVMLDGKIIGEVTSGTLSPTLGKSIALAYVDAAHTAVGTALSVDLKGTPNPATLVKTPFYKRAAT